MSPKVNDLNASRFSIDSQSKQQLPYPKIDFKVDAEFPIRILDNMIAVEEEMNAGFSLYNRGQKLKKSLIDPERVKQYLQKMDMDKRENELGSSPHAQHINLEDQTDGGTEN